MFVRNWCETSTYKNILSHTESMRHKFNFNTNLKQNPAWNFNKFIYETVSCMYISKCSIASASACREMKAMACNKQTSKQTIERKR